MRVRRDGVSLPSLFGGTLGTFGTGIECCRKATLAPWQVDGLSDGNAVLYCRGSVCSAVCFLSSAAYGSW
jgi:hypothetical protein